MAVDRGGIMRTSVKELRREISELRNVGRQMSNICFNLAQGKEFTKYDREVCDGLRREWDAIERADKGE